LHGLRLERGLRGKWSSCGALDLSTWRIDLLMVADTISGMTQIEASASLSGTGSVTAEATVFRREFIEAMGLLARACDELAARGCQRPIVVGGAAVEFYTGGAIMSGDVDFFTDWQQEFENILVSLGFRREDRIGHFLRGLYHPTLDIGVEVVSGEFFDGHADQTKVRLVEMKDGHSIPFAPIEDLIADRLGQYASGSGGKEEMRQQAIALYRLAGELDEAYVDKRIREDTCGTLGLDDLKGMVS
jgi:hypothetical protein